MTQNLQISQFQNFFFQKSRCSSVMGIFASAKMGLNMFFEDARRKKIWVQGLKLKLTLEQPCAQCQFFDFNFFLNVVSIEKEITENRKRIKILNDTKH